MKIPSLEQSPIGLRFIISILLMFIPLTIFTISGIIAFNAVVKALDEVVVKATEEMHPVMNIQTKIHKSSIVLHDYIINGNLQEREKFYTQVLAVEAAFEKIPIAPFELNNEHSLLRSAYKEWHVSQKIASDILLISNPQENPIANQLMENFDSHLKRTNNILNQMHEITMNEMNEQKVYAANLRHKLFIVFGIFFIMGLGTAAVVSIKLTRSILLPVRALERTTERLAKGDFTCRVPFERDDELGKLGKAFNIMATRLENSQAVLEKLATMDPLTDVYNHREFYHRLNIEINRALRYSRVFSVLILDVDNFKAINDTYGHPAGDKALLHIATAIVKEIRPGDVCARYGGDEFAIILPETPISRALNLAERIRCVIAEHKIAVTPSHAIKLTVSIGLAEFPKDGKSGEELIYIADKSLYTSKRSGRNIVYHEPDS